MGRIARWEEAGQDIDPAWNPKTSGRAMGIKEWVWLEVPEQGLGNVKKKKKKWGGFIGFQSSIFLYFSFFLFLFFSFLSFFFFLFWLPPSVQNSWARDQIQLQSRPKLQPQQCRILNPLCRARDSTCVSGLPRHFGSHYATAGNPKTSIFQVPPLIFFFFT